MVISRAILVNCWPFLASVRAFLCLIDDHLECPDIFSPSRSLTQLQPHHSMRSAAQDPTVLRCDFFFRRAHRLIVDRQTVLAGEAAGFALAAGEPSVDKELRDVPLTPHHGPLLRAGATKRATFLPIGIRGGIWVELVDETLS